MSDDHHEFDCNVASPAEDMVIARRAFAEGDLHHAAHHAACAISVDPREEHVSFIDEIMEASRDPLDLAPLGENTFYGTVALRAHLLHRLGQHADAIDLLLQVIGVRPDVPYLDWLDNWIDDEEFLEGIAPDPFAAAIQACLDQMGRTELGEQCRPTVVPRLIDIIAVVRQRHLDHGPLALLHSRMARLVDDLDTAYTIALEHHRRAPGYISAVALAGAHRVRGELEEAVRLFREALVHAPEDLAVRLDIGDLSLDRDRLDDALAAYDEVLDREADHPWAKPSKVYVQYLQSGAPELRDQLETLADQGPSNVRALALLDSITPYVGFLPGRREAIINLARHILDQDATPTGEINLSSIEAPSAVAAAAMALEGRGVSLEVSVDEIPEPDPREPRHTDIYELWHYEETLAQPGMQPPSSDQVGSAVAGLAGTIYHLDGWTHHAQSLAERFDFSMVESFLAIMVHPPPCPAEIPLWSWMFRVQVASSLTIAFIDDGWEESVRRRALLSLVRGPIDWTTTAGIVSLTALACAEPTLEKGITSIFEELLAIPRSPIWHMCVEEPLAHCMLLLPALTPERRREIRDLREEIERNE